MWFFVHARDTCSTRSALANINICSISIMPKERNGAELSDILYCRRFAHNKMPQFSPSFAGSSLKPSGSASQLSRTSTGQVHSAQYISSEAYFMFVCPSRCDLAGNVHELMLCNGRWDIVHLSRSGCVIWSSVNRAAFACAGCTVATVMKHARPKPGRMTVKKYGLPQRAGWASL